MTTSRKNFSKKLIDRQEMITVKSWWKDCNVGHVSPFAVAFDKTRKKNLADII